MRRSVLTWVMGVLATVLLLACGGGPDRTKANLRLINATSGYPALDLLVDGQRRFSSVVFGDTAQYVEIDPDDSDSVLTLPGSSTPLLSLTPAVKEERHYTLLAYGTEGALKSVLLDDNADDESGKVRLRVVNGAPDAGSVDVYVTAVGDPLATAVALQAGAEVGTVGGFSTLDAATWRVRVTGAGDKTDLRLDVSNVVLARGQVVTLVITPVVGSAGTVATGGVLVSALLATQEGSIVPLAGTQARVRVAAPNTGTVSASVGGTALMSDQGTPVVGPYELVTAGTLAVAVTVDDTSLPASSFTLAPGSDYTLLVFKSGGAPAAVWLSDDNRAPDAAGRAKLRLVHGLDGLTGALSLKANLLPIGAGVALGAASATYGAVSAGTNVRVTVDAAGPPPKVVADMLDQTLVSGGVYSVFVVSGTVAPTTGVLVRDR